MIPFVSHVPPRPIATLAAAAVSLALAGPAAAEPDLTGVWTNASWTQLERPRDAPGLALSEAQARALHAAGERRLAAAPGVGQATSEFPEMGQGYARIGGQLRSSWLVDPPDGRLPYTPATKAAVQAYGAADGPGAYDNVEARPTGERCLTAEGAGAPILNSADSNLVTLVQTPDALVIVSEKNHDARIVRLGQGQDPPVPPGQPASWLGTSVGHWEGATLVVETTRLRPGLTWQSDTMPLSDRARVTERFTRVGPDEIDYGFTVDDPGAYARPWRGEMVFRRSVKPMFEYACHEGNYSLAGILAGGQKEQAAADAAKGN